MLRVVRLPPTSHSSGYGFAGASGTSDPDDTFLYRGFDDSSVKGEKGEAALGKADFSRAFHEVVTLITGFFPHATPSSSSSCVGSFPWMDICGTSLSRDPRIFLSLFDKLSVLSKAVNEKFRKTADEKQKTSTALLHWGDVYRLGDKPDFHKAPKVNESFSRLLDKPVSSSRYVALSLEDTSKLETCMCGLIESQSFSLWSIVTMFEFLKDANCVPEDSIFRQLIVSMTTALNSQAKASFSVAAFLQQALRESFVSHLPGSTHPSVKHALLSTPSSSDLFDEEVIRYSLTQVEDDSRLSLLKNLSSPKGGNQSASTSSPSGRRRCDSSSASSSSRSREFSRPYRGSKRPASSSPSRQSKVAFKDILRSPTPKKNFSK